MGLNQREAESRYLQVKDTWLAQSHSFTFKGVAGQPNQISIAAPALEYFMFSLVPCKFPRILGHVYHTVRSLCPFSSTWSTRNLQTEFHTFPIRFYTSYILWKHWNKESGSLYLVLAYSSLTLAAFWFIVVNMTWSFIHSRNSRIVRPVCYNYARAWGTCSVTSTVMKRNLQLLQSVFPLVSGPMWFGSSIIARKHIMFCKYNISSLKAERFSWCCF